MDFYLFLQNTWFVLVGVLLAGYSILDGFDLGIGALFPILARNHQDKRLLMNAVGPFWDGNEVWLLTGGGALFAAFPNVYATVFSGFYLALMLVLFALILRAVSLEFWAHDSGRESIWEWCFTIGSLLPALLFGVALGNVMMGIPLAADWEYTGTFFTLLRPFPLALGVLGLLSFLLQGSVWALYKTEGALQNRAKAWGEKISLVVLAALPVVFVMGVIFIPGAAGRIPAYIFLMLSMALVYRTRVLIRRGEEFKPLLFSSAYWLSLWGIVASWQYPNLVRASDNAALNMTLSNVSSSQLTLTVMAIIAVVGMPVVIAYTTLVYRAFKGKVKLD